MPLTVSHQPYHKGLSLVSPKGTYNFVNLGPEDAVWLEKLTRSIGHFIFDMLPYFIMGN